MEIVNLIAVVVIPIAAVVIGQYLQDRSEKRKDKMKIFKTLVSSRIYGWTYESVNDLNLIEIVFSDDKEVCRQWRKYYQVLSVQSSDVEHLKMMQEESDNLLKAISRSLGYSEESTNEILKKPYMPVGMSTQMNQQQNFQNAQLQASLLLMNMLSSQNKETGVFSTNGQDSSKKADVSEKQ